MNQLTWEYEWTQNHKCLKHSYEIPASESVHHNHLSVAIKGGNNGSQSNGVTSWCKNILLT